MNGPVSLLAGQVFPWPSVIPTLNFYQASAKTIPSVLPLLLRSILLAMGDVRPRSTDRHRRWRRSRRF